MATVLKTVIGASLSRVQIPAPPPMSCRKTSFTVFQRSRRELELRSRAQDFGRHGRPLNSKTTLPTRTRLARRPGRSPRSGFCQRAERVNYVLKSHTGAPDQPLNFAYVSRGLCSPAAKRKR